MEEEVCARGKTLFCGQFLDLIFAWPFLSHFSSLHFSIFTHKFQLIFVGLQARQPNELSSGVIHMSSLLLFLETSSHPAKPRHMDLSRGTSPVSEAHIRCSEV